MLTVDQIIQEHYPAFNDRKIIAPMVKPLLRHLLHEKEFINFDANQSPAVGIDFVEQVLDYFHFSFAVSDRERENIPTTGKVLIVANHPIGSLDGLALIKLIYEIRSDVKVVANDLLMTVNRLSPLLLPVKNMTRASAKVHIRKIIKTLDDDAAVIIFPAGEVSRLGPGGIKDGKWQQGFLKFAEQTKAPVLPVFIDGRNSARFYCASLMAKPLSTIMLVGEMFRQKEKLVRITVGSVIPYRSYNALNLSRKDKIKLFRKHVYRLGRGKRLLFETESAIARPERKVDLKKDIRKGEILGKTPDGKIIFLFSGMESSPVMREIGRLREITFRAVGEGTGKRRDLDHFDRYYHHLVLWDEEELEITGAYRFADSVKIIEEKGSEGLYTCSLFNLNFSKSPFMRNGLELGRSFVQQRYWGKRSLDYLWYGIGSFLAKKTQYRYLFGPVSISNAMPQAAKDFLIYFYKLYFSPDQNNQCSRNPFSYSQPQELIRSQFTGNHYKEDFKRLKTLLANLGTTVPPLYKQYTELCEPGGVTFLDFNIDPDFGNCVDGLVIVDISKITQKKRKRYMEDNILH